MRLLFLSVMFPFPATNGRHIRSMSLIKALAGAGHDVHLLSYGSAKDVTCSAVSDLCRSVTIVNRTESSSLPLQMVNRVRFLGSPEPYGSRRFYSEEMETAVRRALGEHSPSAVICDTIDAAINVPPEATVPIILNQHNVEHLILERYLALERNPLRKWYMQMECGKLRNWENHVCAKSRLVLVCSEHDRQVTQQLCGHSSVVVVPNVVELDDYQSTAQEDPLRVVYAGGMDWYPNRDAVEFFAEKIFPEIQRQIPGVTFVVAGRNPPKSFVNRFVSIRNMRFTGTVSDMQPELVAAAVCVVPLRIGSGTRLKILEAAALGKPIVSTTLGAEGLAFTDGLEIILKDKPAEFAAAVEALLRNADRRRILGGAARRRVEQEYSVTALRSAAQGMFLHLRSPVSAVPVTVA
ncbi:MAG: glycosyltransferase [Candidatus Sulfotelmatobacter sp.]